MNRSKHEDLKTICEIRCKSNIGFSHDMLLMLLSSLESDCYRIFRDSFDNPMGYIIWANVNQESLYRLVRSERFPRYPYEWTEGNINLILDVVKLDSNMKPLLALARELSEVAYQRKRKFIGYVRSKIGLRHFRINSDNLNQFFDMLENNSPIEA